MKDLQEDRDVAEIQRRKRAVMHCRNKKKVCMRNERKGEQLQHKEIKNGRH
jgi:hypothetical protein